MNIPPNLPEPTPPVARVYEFPPVANIPNSETAEVIQLRPIVIQPTRICLGPTASYLGRYLPSKRCPRCDDIHYRYNGRFKCYSCGFIELDVLFKGPKHYTNLSAAFRIKRDNSN